MRSLIAPVYLWTYMIWVIDDGDGDGDDDDDYGVHKL